MALFFLYDSGSNLFFFSWLARCKTSQFTKTKTVIVDLRFNGGGYETVALKLLSYFINEPKHILSVKAKKDNGYTKEQKYVLEPSENIYKGKLIVLTSHRTASAAEIFALGTLAYPEIKRFGSSTNGIFSEILWKNLPNGWEFSLSNEVYSDQNGNVYEITGVPVIINTSMNVMGEPIVNTPEQAYQMIVKTDMDYLVLGKYLISREIS